MNVFSMLPAESKIKSFFLNYASHNRNGLPNLMSVANSRVTSLCLRMEIGCWLLAKIHTQSPVIAEMKPQAGWLPAALAAKSARQSV